jgi:hypothetical protein
MRRREPIFHHLGARAIAIDLERCFLDPELSPAHGLEVAAGSQRLTGSLQDRGKAD